jgi:hypothetical protein
MLLSYLTIGLLDITPALFRLLLRLLQSTGTRLWPLERRKRLRHVTKLAKAIKVMIDDQWSLFVVYLAGECWANVFDVFLEGCMCTRNYANNIIYSPTTKTKLVTMSD